MTADDIDAYIRRIREQLEANTAAVRTRTIAMGYAFGRNDQRVADGCEPDEDGAATRFADFYEKHTDGRWCDLIDLYTKFRAQKGAAA
jgi:hypothetical protein